MNADWHPDPTGKHELRYWDGSQWTEHVVDAGQQSTDPIGAAPSDGGGQQGQQAQQPAQQGGGYGQQGGQPQQGGQQGFGGDVFGGLSGDLIDGRFSEVSGPGASLQNSKMLRVRITEPFMAKQGSMVAYQGNVNFHFQGGGAGKFIKKALTGEGLSLMRVEGQGDVFIADTAKHVHILQVNNSGISVSGKNVLAFSSSLQYNIERVKGAGIATGGLFNTTLRGSGWVAITTEGEPVVLNAAEAPTFADTDAIVAWSINLDTSLRSTLSAGALIGRGSGEAVQVAFSGQGFVIVQPSEGYPVAGQQ
ncbi:AIM24 family protein [Nocardioides marinquilinus]|uniref:AIM24 family protein n=1 Tax=Nocardioides marinquilinus TaxID=1210400 RepID=A0ABP9PCC8_9ACTN